jgi:predicted  nucleic acid-binding Zn-ribbon protein
MNASTQRAALPEHPVDEDGAGPITSENAGSEGGFDHNHWEAAEARHEFSGAGGRAVLGSTLALLAALWLGYTAWSAGRALGDAPLSSPALAQWVAIAAGPLALLGLVWLMFGRTRRKEAERFTRSVVAMRSEAQSLQALLGVLSTEIGERQAELQMIAQHLMKLGNDATVKLSDITRDLDSSSERMAQHGQALDRAAESARNDIAVLLDDLPKAEQSARAMAEQLRGAGGEASSQAATFEQRLATLSSQAREAEETVSGAAQRLVEQLGQVEQAGSTAAARIGEAESGLTGALDTLLDRTAATLDQIRTGVDTQSAAVAALVEQANAGIGRAGIEAADALHASVGGANAALDALSAKIAEQERASQRIVAETARALGELDQHFAALADTGDERAASFVEALGRARSELDQLGQQGAAQAGAIGELSGRTTALRDTVEQLTQSVRDQLATAVGDAEAGASRLAEAAKAAKPEIAWMREAAVEASDRIEKSASGIAEQQDRFAAFLASLDEGVEGAEAKLASLASAVAAAQEEASRLGHETGPALVAAMVQVREAAAHAAERAREAIASVVPESAEQLSGATREALEKVIRESIEERLREVETTAAKAVDAARSASDRLTQQMLSLGQSAVALEQHVERTSAAQREKDSEAFARRVSLLIDSMHSASIDVGKILSDEVDEKAWDSYLKGNRGVFTRRAVRLIDGTEAKAIRAHYDTEPEFQQSANRYVHDFEAMLRRVLAERDGGLIAVTLMSSDMGKLYAALAQAIDKRR